jgi:hypothetical protein
LFILFSVICYTGVYNENDRFLPCKKGLNVKIQKG